MTLYRGPAPAERGGVMADNNRFASRRYEPRSLFGTILLAALVLLSELLVLSDELVYGLVGSRDGTRNP